MFYEKTTKEKYIENHPRAALSKALKRNRWDGKTKITIISGLISKNKYSHLSKALSKSKLGKYCVGGKLGFASEGYMMAVA